MQLQLDMCWVAIIWRLDWGWRTHFQGGPLLWLASSIFCCSGPSLLSMWTSPCSEVFPGENNWPLPEHVEAGWKLQYFLWPSLRSHVLMLFLYCWSHLQVPSVVGEWSVQRGDLDIGIYKEGSKANQESRKKIEQSSWDRITDLSPS